jgi:hypothetical protein
VRGDDDHVYNEEPAQKYNTRKSKGTRKKEKKMMIMMMAMVKEVG